MDMDNIVEESHEEFLEDQHQGVISILMDPENPLEK